MDTESATEIGLEALRQGATVSEAAFFLAIAVVGGIVVMTGFAIAIWRTQKNSGSLGEKLTDSMIQTSQQHAAAHAAHVACMDRLTAQDAQMCELLEKTQAGVDQLVLGHAHTQELVCDALDLSERHAEDESLKHDIHKLKAKAARNA